MDRLSLKLRLDMAHALTNDSSPAYYASLGTLFRFSLINKEYRALIGPVIEKELDKIRRLIRRPPWAYSRKPSIWDVNPSNQLLAYVQDITFLPLSFRRWIAKETEPIESIRMTNIVDQSYWHGRTSQKIDSSRKYSEAGVEWVEGPPFYDGKSIKAHGKLPVSLFRSLQAWNPELTFSHTKSMTIVDISTEQIEFRIQDEELDMMKSEDETPLNEDWGIAAWRKMSEQERKRHLSG